MNYAELVKSIKPSVLAAIAAINNPEIKPDVRQLNQEILLRETGKAVYDKVYDMNAFDYDIQHTKGSGIDERYYGLAKKLSGSISGGKAGVDEYVDNYLMTMASKAQNDSFKTAKETRKHPRVKRTESADACKWCQSLAGEYSDPSSDVFKRHGGCNGKIVTEGFKSRNGELNNYKTPEKITVYRGEGDQLGAGGTNLFGDAKYVARDKNVAAEFGKVKKETLTISPKQIYTISSDAQYQALIDDAIRAYPTMNTQQSIPKLLKKRGFKAVEGTPGYDPLAGIAVFDDKLLD